MAENFTPGETIPLTATTTGASASFALAQSVAYTDVMVTNSGNVTAHIGFGDSPPTLPSTSGTPNATPILSGQTMVLRKGNAIKCNAITQTGSASLYFTAGQGN